MIRNYSKIALRNLLRNKDYSFIGLIFLLFTTVVAFSQPIEHRKPPKSIIGKDGAEMVLIPAGKFQMGTDLKELSWVAQWIMKLYPSQLKNITEDSFSYKDETPRHAVYVDAFYMDKYEVTNEQYRRFVKATGHAEPKGTAFIKSTEGKYVIIHDFKPWEDKNFNGDKQPVVCVSHEDARAYAEWAGKLLPTEAQWEKAARGKLARKHFAWGNSWPPDNRQGNFSDEAFNAAYQGASFPYISGYNDGYAYTSLYGSFSPNGYGIYDMVGNVAEWTQDLYSEDYYTTSPKSNPTGYSSGKAGVTRGGSWFYKWAHVFRVADREDIPRSSSSFDVGFRCVTPYTRQ